MALLFDEAAVANTTAQRWPNASFLDEWLAEEINARLAPLTHNFQKTLWQGANAPISLLSKPLGQIDFAIDAASYDLAVSYQQLHSANDVPNALLQLGRTLKPDGMFLACFLGGQSLVELRHVLAQTEIDMRGGISPRVHPMIDLKDAAGLMQAAGFALPVVDSETVELHYGDLFALIRDLRQLGLSNSLTARDKRILPRHFWPQAAARYAQEFSNESGGIKVTFEAIFLSGWRPAETQQMPLARGSVPIGFNSAS